MSLESDQFKFGDFILDVKEKALLRDRKPLAITPKVFELLRVLVENHGHLVEKSYLMDKVWPQSFVEESNLTFSIRQLRKVLGDGIAHPKFIETVPKRGYRFIADVEIQRQSLNGEVEASVINKHSTNEPAERRYVLWTTAGLLVVLGLVAMAYRFAGERRGEAGPPKFTRLTSSGRVGNAVLSHDAKYVVFSQKDEGGESLWLRQLSTGSQTQIMAPKGVEYTGLAITPDNEFIYCSTFSQNEVESPLWRIPLLGGPIAEIPGVSTGVAVSFSPDGSKFAYTESFSANNETQLKVAAADGTGQTVVLTAIGSARSLPTFHSTPVAWSPDGETIACAIEESDAQGSYSRIILIDPDNGREQAFAESRWDFVENVAWIDNDDLAVVADEPDSSASHVWLVSRETGKSRRLTTDLNDHSLLSAAKGELLTLQKTRTSTLRVAVYNEEQKTVEPTEILEESGPIEAVSWSTSGKILYSSSASGKNEIWQIEADGSGARQLTTDARVTYGFAVSPADGSLAFSSSRTGPNSIWLADADGQNIRQLTGGAEDCVPNFTADGRHVVFQAGYGKETPMIYRVVLHDDQVIVKLTDSFSVQPALSPDGTEAAFHFMDSSDRGERKWKIGIISVETGQLHSKLELPAREAERLLRWYPTGNVLTQVAYSGEQADFILLPTNGEPIQRISGAGKGKIASFAWSPDGKHLVFSQITETRDAVLLSDL